MPIVLDFLDGCVIWHAEGFLGLSFVPLFAKDLICKEQCPYGKREFLASKMRENYVEKIAFPRLFSDGEVASHFKQFHDDASLPKESFSRSVGREKLSP